MAMTDDQWYETEQGKAADSFVETAIALSIVLASAEVGAMVTDKLGHLAGVVTVEQLGRALRP